MATLRGNSERVEYARLRRALDDAGFAEGADCYLVHLAEDLDADVWTPRKAAGQDERPERMLVVCCGRRNQSVWRLLASGAEDVVRWDEGALEAVLARLERWRAVDDMLTHAAGSWWVGTRSPVMRRAVRDLVELAAFGRGPLLLLGETGTGKEVAARLVQQVVGGTSLVVVDCTTIVPSLSGSELFGHEKGAFTGAERARGGAFAAADGGTLFLDEIGDLSPALQAELLRVLQEGTYKRVGGDTWSRTRFRLVSATNRDLELDQSQGRFRSDLFHRVASGIVRLPPLRERREDLELLFGHFLREASGHDIEVTASVLGTLQELDFPGNLRELRQLAYAVAARHAGSGPVTPGDVPARYRPQQQDLAQGPPGGRTLDRAVRGCLTQGLTLADLKALVGELAVQAAMDECHGNVHGAATLLGVTDRAVQMRLKVPTQRRSPAQ